ncbi:MAG: PAC2 family protein, partial [Chloroflexota bacterium]
VRFSNYEGGATIGAYLLDKAEKEAIEYFVFYAFVPAYDFSHLSARHQGLRIEDDYKAWSDLLERFNHMFGLNIDLSELEEHSQELMDTMAAKFKELEEEAPELKIKEFLAELAQEFTERTFMPLDDVWERELGDLFDDEESVE